MIHAISILVIYFLNCTSVENKQTSGTIYFTNDTSIAFESLKYFTYFFNRNDIEATESAAIMVNLNKSNKKIRADKIKKISILKYEINEGEDYLRNVTIEVTTKTGESFQGSYKFFDSVTVLTEGKQTQVFKFAQNGSLTIKAIEFN